MPKVSLSVRLTQTDIDWLYRESNENLSGQLRDDLANLRTLIRMGRSSPEITLKSALEILDLRLRS
jgi:hypothetical protein